MSHALIISEGPDDLRALRSIFERNFELAVQRGKPRQFRQAPMASDDGTRRIQLVNGRDKRQAGMRAVEAIDEFASGAYDRIGLVFDPDIHKDIEWREWCLRLLKGHEVQTSDLVWSIDRPGATSEDSVAIPFVPVPWDINTPFDDLNERFRNLERVALAIARRGAPDDADLVEHLLSEIRERGRKTSWKTAFRLLHALRKPASDAGIVDQVFGQDPALREHIPVVLGTTGLWPRLQYLAGLSPAESRSAVSADALPKKA